MEAVIGLFMIVIIVALLSGTGRSSTESQRPVTRIEIAPNGSAGATSLTKDSSSGGSAGSIVPALILLLTVMALMFNAG